jgi:trk system potassium uptake protein TrkA
MKKQIAVFGLGRFGISLATTLASEGHDVLAIDKDETKIQNVASLLTHAVQADAVNESVLSELGIANFDIAIVAIGSAIESSVLTTILLKKLGVKYVIARANDELHGSILEKIGADHVVYAEREMGSRVAHGILLTDVSDYMTITPNYGVVKYRVSPRLVGESLESLELGRTGKWEVAALLIQRENEVIVTPDKAEVLRESDIMILAGSDDKLVKMLTDFRERKNNDK